MKKGLLGLMIVCILCLGVGCSLKQDETAKEPTENTSSVLEETKLAEDKTEDSIENNIEDKIEDKTEDNTEVNTEDNTGERSENNTEDKNQDKINASQQEQEMPMTLEEKQEAMLTEYINTMTPEEKIGQLFMVAFRKDSNGNLIQEVSQPIKDFIKEKHIGGVILFSENIQTNSQVQTFIKDLQQSSQIPLFIGVDEEGGLVSRIGKLQDTPFQKAFTLGKTGEPQKAYDEARRMGVALKTLGFNMDFAPDADIFNEPQNTVIGQRSFGNTAEEVTPMVLAFARGLKDENIIAVVKHFPGHGNTKEDSHTGMAYVDKTLEELQNEELKPFMAALDEGIDGMMKGHLLVHAVDEKRPASLSSKWQAYLESQANVQQTLLITDAMNMGAITSLYSSADAAKASILDAGNDIILMPEDFDAAYEALCDAYRSGELTEERLNASVRKILSKKIAQKIIVLS